MRSEYNIYLTLKSVPISRDIDNFGIKANIIDFILGCLGSFVWNFL